MESGEVRMAYNDFCDCWHDDKGNFDVTISGCRP